MTILSITDPPSTGPSAGGAEDAAIRARSPFDSFGTGIFTEQKLSGAGFGRRLAARLIDVVFLNVIGMIIGMVLSVVIALMAALQGIPAEDALLRVTRVTLPGTLFSLAGSLSYFVAFEWLWGSTPGKRMLGLVVVTEDLGRCTLAAAIRRNLAWVLESLFWGIPAYLAISNSPRGQRHGDRWAGTIVPRRDAVPPVLLGTMVQFLLAAFVALVLDSLATMASVVVKLI